MPFDPMLATSGPLPPADERWAYEPKWDGFRAVVHLNGRTVVWSRRGTDLTDRFPEVYGLTAAVSGDTVLDGELVVLDGSGRPGDELIQSVIDKGLAALVSGGEMHLVGEMLHDDPTGPIDAALWGLGELVYGSG